MKTTQDPTLVQLVDQVYEYVRHASLLRARCVPLDELRQVFGIGKIDLYQVIHILEERGDVKDYGSEVALTPNRRPCWIK